MAVTPRWRRNGGCVKLREGAYYKTVIVVGEEASEHLMYALVEIMTDVSSSGKYMVLSLDQSEQNTDLSEEMEQSSSGENAETGERCAKRRRFDQELFHVNLR
jgi:hypothetical protein